MKLDGLYQVTANNFCAGIVVFDGTVKEAAPILGWLRGKTIEFVYMKCKALRWGLEPVEITK